MRERRTNMRERCSRYSFILDISSLDVLTLNSSSTQILLVLVRGHLLGTWPSACYQRVDVLSQLLDIHSAFELLLGTWPCACYQRVDVLSQLFDSSLHVGFRNYQSSPTRRARTENKKVNDHSRSSVNTREVSEGSMGGVSH